MDLVHMNAFLFHIFLVHIMSLLSRLHLGELVHNLWQPFYQSVVTRSAFPFLPALFCSTFESVHAHVLSNRITTLHQTRIVLRLHRHKIFFVPVVLFSLLVSINRFFGSYSRAQLLRISTFSKRTAYMTNLFRIHFFLISIFFNTFNQCFGNNFCLTYYIKL